MKKVAVVTDSNSGITQKEGEELGIFVLPMPFNIDGNDYLEGVSLSQRQFYEKQEGGSDIFTSQPATGDVMDLWDRLLNEYDQVLHIPMSSGLSSSFATALMLSEDYDGKVQVVNNQRISITQKSSVFDAIAMVKDGKNANEIKAVLEKMKAESSIYITLETLKYLKKGGRITPAAAAIGEIFKIKPVLQIQGEKLDAFAKARTKKQAKKIMLAAIKTDFEKRFNVSQTGEEMEIFLAYSGEDIEIKEFLQEVREIYPNHIIHADPLSLSVSCHIGPGAIAIACAKKYDANI